MGEKVDLNTDEEVILALIHDDEELSHCLAEIEMENNSVEDDVEENTGQIESPHTLELGELCEISLDDVQDDEPLCGYLAALEQEDEESQEETSEGEEEEGEDDENEVCLQQRGGGVEGEEAPYVLRSVERRYARRFRTRHHNYQLQFNRSWLQRQAINDLHDVLRDMFDRIINDLRRHMGIRDADRLGFALRHPALDAPLRVPLRHADMVRGEDIMALVEKVQQSNTSVGIDESMDISILHVEDPNRLGEGNGLRSKKAIQGVEEFVASKQSIIRIRNNDDLCFARALAVAVHYSKRAVPFNAKSPEGVIWTREYRRLTRVDRGEDYQLRAARKLATDLGVNLGPCTGKDTWVAYAERLTPDYVIKVYSREVFNKLLYTSEAGTDDAKVLRLYHHDNHYDVIKSMTGFTGYSYYCDKCETGFSSRKNHKCTRKFACNQCHRYDYCGARVDHGKPCHRCNRWFPNERCFQRHKEDFVDATNGGGRRRNTCKDWERCLSCFREFQTIKPHECKIVKRLCSNCKEPRTPEHLCYMVPLKSEEEGDDERLAADGREKQKFIFYDFECTQENGNHVPNYCVVQMGCGSCIGSESDQLCENCPWRMQENEGPARQKDFKGPTTLEDMGTWLIKVAEFKRKGKKRRRNDAGQEQVQNQEDVEVVDDDRDDSIIVIAHNYKGYDGHLLLRYLHTHLVQAPDIVLNGQKILQMKVGRLSFKDSLNFLGMPLKKFPKTFQLAELKKGWFPHFFNIPANENYKGPYPPKHTYGADSMDRESRASFIEWHNNKVATNAVFDMAAEISAYCQSDVDILRRGCHSFRDLFIRQNNVDPFKEAVTLPMSCMSVFRKNYLEAETIAIIPPHGYRPEKRYSQQCLHWLRWLMHQDPALHIQHAKNGGEVQLRDCENRTLTVDGYDREKRWVWEYLGCFWHGCPRCYKYRRDEPHAVLGITMRELHQKTMFRLALLKEHPDVRCVIIMWECDFKTDIRDSEELQAFLQNYRDDFKEPLDPREAFFGGRTNATTLYYKAQEDEKIMYVDVCSLYPYICKYGKFPIGHPEIVDQPPVASLMDLHGLIQCRVLPPRNLYHPLLPYRSAGKLMFPLCKVCADTQNAGGCTHADADRAWFGTYTTIEVQEAVQKYGYRVLHIYEAWHFSNFSEYNPQTREGGLFTKYIDAFFKLKQQSSEVPDEYKNNIEGFIRETYEKEGVLMDAENIRVNKGLRTLAKGCLNNLWGKFGQRLGFDKSEYITQPRRFYDLLDDEKYVIKDGMVINDSMMFLSYQPQKDFHTPNPSSNVVLASWVTAQARLKLYGYLAQLQRRVLYFDTDSVIYVHKPGHYNPPLGSNLGDLTDELDGNWITEFVSGGPKNYAYKLDSRNSEGVRSVCKVRGFTLNYRASKLVNFNTVSKLIRKKQKDTINVPYPKRIVRAGMKNGNELLSKDTSKMYRMVYTKRRLVPNENNLLVNTLPYGWQD